MPDLDFATLQSQFHWLRPVWLLGIPVALLIGAYLLRGRAHNSQWSKFINPQLLPYLLQGKISKQQRWPLFMLTFALILASLAMAGPSWEKLPQPIHKTESALVILYDMSPSMMAEDLKPSRLVRSRLKLIDLLKQRQEGLTALIAYAGEAHTVTPLTDDTDTISSLLPSLSPNVMPMSGSNTEMAFDQALTLFRDSGLTQGDILLVTDGVAIDAQQYIRRKLPMGFRLSILGVGTEAGAPIPVNIGGFAKDRNGGIVLARLNEGELSELATKSGGKYRTLSHDDSDIEALNPKPELLDNQTRELEREFDSWLDRGAWLALLLIPLVAFSFRRGWLLVLPFLVVLPERSYAFEWKDLWQTKDQQAQELLQQNKASEAAEIFTREDWKATAQYRAQQYEQAAETFARQETADGHYNAGNALARAGKLKEAIEAYNQALSQQLDFEDAKANKDLVEKLLKQQQQNPQQNSSDNQNQQGDQQDSQGDNSQNQQNSGQQNQDSGDQESQQENQQQPQNNDSEGQQNDGSQNQPNPEPSDDSEQSDGSQQDGSQQDNSGDNDKERTGDSPTPPAHENTDQEQPSQQAEPQGNGDEQGKDSEQSAQAMQAAEEDGLQDEEKQAMEQWLRKIPDDPSGLMRKKFEYQYRQRRLQNQQENWQLPGGQSEQRW